MIINKLNNALYVIVKRLIPHLPHLPGGKFNGLGLMFNNDMGDIRG